MLATEARKGPNTQDRAASLIAVSGHNFEHMMAIFHLVLLERSLANHPAPVSPSSSSVRNKVWNFTSSEFMSVGDADTPCHPQFFRAVTFEFQRLTEDSP